MHSALLRLCNHLCTARFGIHEMVPASSEASGCALARRSCMCSLLWQSHRATVTLSVEAAGAANRFTCCKKSSQIAERQMVSFGLAPTVPAAAASAPPAAAAAIFPLPSVFFPGLVVLGCRRSKMTQGMATGPPATANSLIDAGCPHCRQKTEVIFGPKERPQEGPNGRIRICSQIAADRLLIMSVCLLSVQFVAHKRFFLK
jgi:hypothetical protein